MTHRSWNSFIYYGEVVGFLAAWAIGLLVATYGGRDSGARADAENLAAASTGEHIRQ